MLRICVNSHTIAGRRGADPYNIKSKYSQNKKCAFHPVRARTKFTPAYPVSATPTAFASRIGQFPPLYAGVLAMRARICLAISCAMFARVVYLRLRGAAKPSIFALPRTARTRHAWLARLTRARGERFQREGKALFDDFCRAFGHSKAR